MEGENPRKPLTNEEISKEINKFFANNPTITGLLSTETQEKRLFSQEFFEKIEGFDNFSSKYHRKQVREGPEQPNSLEFYEKPKEFVVFLKFD